MKKLHPIVMLPTEKSNLIACDDGTLFYYHKEQTGGGIAQCQHLYILSDEEIKEGDWYYTKRHGEGVYQNIGGRAIEYKGPIDNWHHKVIATTDKSLGNNSNTLPCGHNISYWNLASYGTGYCGKCGNSSNNVNERELLPQIPESFLPIVIKVYNEGNPITEVELEYEVIGTGKVRFPSLMGDMTEYCGIDRHILKTTDNNEVIIHLPKEKMYSREVLKSMFRKIFIEGGKCARNFEYDFDIDKWIEENL